jgi:hypothetical protein
MVAHEQIGGVGEETAVGVMSNNLFMVVNVPVRGGSLAGIVTERNLMPLIQVFDITATIIKPGKGSRCQQTQGRVPQSQYHIGCVFY